MNTIYAVVKFTHSDKLIPAVERLESCKDVESWDAVEGQADLVLLIRSQSGGVSDAVRQLDGVKRVSAYEVLNGEECASTPKPLPIRAYLLIDTAPEQQETVRKAILALPGTLSCVKVRGGCDLVALVKGETLSALKQTISRKIRLLDGVLRLKPHYAFNIKQL